MKVLAVTIIHLVAIASLFWLGLALNDTIIRSQAQYAGVVAVFSVAFGLYTTALNFLYSRSHRFRLFISRLKTKLSRSHTFWQPHVAMQLSASHPPAAALLEMLWKNLADGDHGVARRKALTDSTMTVTLDDLLVVAFRVTEVLSIGFEQKLLVPSHLYDAYRQRLAKLCETAAHIAKPTSIDCGITISFETGTKNPYYGLFVNHVPAELLQEFQVTFRLDERSSCRVEATEAAVNIESHSVTDLFEGLRKVVGLQALPGGVNT